MLARVGLPLIAAGLVIALAAGGVSKALGAHPFWDVQIALIGAPIGAVAATLLPARWAFAVIAALATFSSYGLAHYGKTRFAASYAEDALAGQLWYFGWIGVAAFAALAVGLAFRTLKA